MILSVLDQTPIAAGTSPASALANSLDLAQHCEALGYHRYWLAEHHASPALAGSAPEILIAAIAAATRRMRIGSGGVMLPHYSPLKVAEQFSLLAGLHPDRIDLGLGRAPGSDQRTSVALQRDRRQYPPHDFPNQLAELIGYLEDTLPADHPFAPYARTLPGLPQAGRRARFPATRPRPGGRRVVPTAPAGRQASAAPCRDRERRSTAPSADARTSSATVPPAAAPRHRFRQPRSISPPSPAAHRPGGAAGSGRDNRQRQRRRWR